MNEVSVTDQVVAKLIECEAAGIDISVIKDELIRYSDLVTKLICHESIEECINCDRAYRGYSPDYDAIIDTMCDYKHICSYGDGTKSLYKHPLESEVNRYDILKYR